MASDPLCSVTMPTTPATAGIEVVAELVGEDAFLTSTDAAVSDRIKKGTTDGAGSVTLDLYRAVRLNAPQGGGTRKYRWRAQSLGIDVLIEVPNSDTANLQDIIVAGS